MVIERLSLGIHDSWDSEVILQKHSADVQEAILARKADIAEAYSELNTIIRMHLTITQAMVSLAEMLQMTPGDVEREFATLRHMEKARAQLREGKKILCMW